MVKKSLPGVLIILGAVMLSLGRLSVIATAIGVTVLGIGFQILGMLKEPVLETEEPIKVPKFIGMWIITTITMFLTMSCFSLINEAKLAGETTTAAVTYLAVCALVITYSTVTYRWGRLFRKERENVVEK